MRLSLVASLLTVVASSTVAWAQQTAYGQCGGQGWTGPTTCVSGWTCVYSNTWYSQCLQSTGGSTPTSTTSAAVSTTTSNGVFRNPLKTSNGSDPYMVYSNGYYYLMTTTWSNLQLSRGRTLKELKSSTPKVIWKDTTTARCCNFWAPEIHSIGGVWYIYYSAGASGDNASQRIHVVKASGSDLWASTWSYAGRIVFPNRDVWSIDATIATLNGSNYIIYSTQDNNAQCLFIAPLTSPTTAGNAYVLSRPTYSWEQVGWNVNEGPVPLYHSGRTWIVYSASLCSGTGYKLGRLEYIGGDPLSQSSWSKYSQPILQSANG
ncbi:hypothetical protein FRC14_000900 [Serendipita sp. 396]|nr:hypothetical protein FRC14_000900 [Serendipita sp. 396]KAG8785773.1 hypothetical protein FRC15_000731 [Serendipita sp. 397]KAG8858155.1 hypothetical protein FRB91_010233 [Serendipita sp. 411]KAG8869672.1 hypothetical protein FRC20_001115 [Serendipita sp. 405]KAG9051864.1 hypothetical protein FS842_010908 [Serendipita sp. 407]